MGIMNKMKTVDLGILGWRVNPYVDNAFSAELSSTGTYAKHSDVEGYTYSISRADKTWFFANAGTILFVDASISTPQAFKSAMQGVILTYETIDSVEEKIINGWNLWDEQWKNGTFNWNTGEIVPASNRIINKNPIPLSPSKRYFIVSPNRLEIMLYDDNMNFVRHIYPSATAPYFDTNSNERYMNFNDTTRATYNHDIAITVVDLGIYTPHQQTEEII